MLSMKVLQHIFLVVSEAARMTVKELFLFEQAYLSNNLLNSSCNRSAFWARRYLQSHTSTIITKKGSKGDSVPAWVYCTKSKWYCLTGKYKCVSVQILDVFEGHLVLQETEMNICFSEVS